VTTGNVGQERPHSVPPRQRHPAPTSVRRRLSVVAGGPGTGKTTTVARILALVHAQATAAGARPPLVALAAPTGKAAARLEEAVHDEAAGLKVSDEARGWLLSLSASTLHRLLGWKPGSRTRFRHDRANRLPHELVIVDETSMVSLSLMARLLEAVRPAARLVLVGDPEQLASVEAGAVLGDVVGPAAAFVAPASAAVEPGVAAVEPGIAAAEPVEAAVAPGVVAAEPGVAAADLGAQTVPPAVETIHPAASFASSIVVLRRVHRFGGAIAELAAAVQQGDAEAVVGVLRTPRPDVRWIPVDVAGARAEDLAPVRAAVVAAGGAVVEAARAGEGRAALEALGAFRLLCAHRRGPHGVATWTGQVESWLTAAIEGFAVDGAWYAGRPLLFTQNDYSLRLYNGDTGVVVAAPDGAGGVRAVFERRGRLLELSPHRLSGVETVHAMTVHKAQGSQFGEVCVLLPDPSSPILTRQLLYTAVTRARRSLLVVGSEEAVRAAVERPIARASGLRELLWGEDARHP
jgi:exodeoxyribonuclease V alpha subunit